MVDRVVQRLVSDRCRFLFRARFELGVRDLCRRDHGDHARRFLESPLHAFSDLDALGLFRLGSSTCTGRIGGDQRRRLVRLSHLSFF